MKRNIAVYETDVEEDFSRRTGALFVSGQKPWSNRPYGAEAVLPNIVAIHDHAVGNDWKVLGSVDRHFYEDAELIRNEGGVFDDHCMNGTNGQLRIKELEPQKDIYIRAKDGPMLGIRTYTEQEMNNFVDSDMQLIFEKQNYDVDTNPNFELAMKTLIDDGLKKIVFNGFATDYCDKAAVLAAAKYRDKFDADLQLYVVVDAIEAVNVNFQGEIDMNFGEKALDEMVNVGAHLVNTKNVLESLV